MAFTRFASRAAAGLLLAERVAALAPEDPVVLALPRGGVPVAVAVARRLKAPLDLLLVRKIGLPGQPELAAAALVEGATPDIVFNQEVMTRAGSGADAIVRAAAAERAEIARRRRVYRGNRQPVPVAGRTAILVDDGIATGTTVRAALRGLRVRQPRRLVLAVPVAAPDSIAALRSEVDDIVCLQQPAPFYAIGQFYADFHQLSDDEVIRLLAAPAEGSPPGEQPGRTGGEGQRP